MKPLSLFLILALLAAGCVRPGGRVAQGNHDQVFYWGNGNEPTDLDPQTDIAETDSHILYALFEGLVSQDPKDLHPIPGVAESWEVSSDGRTYTFHLRADARWSDGAALTSRDFLESYRRMLSPRLGAQYAEFFWKDGAVVNAKEFYDGKITDFGQVGFRAPDARTLVIELVNPAGYFLSLVANPPWFPVPVATIRKYGALDDKANPWTKVGHLVGNGAFTLKSWHTEQEVVVARNPRYWDAKQVRLREIHYYPTENIDSEERDFRAGLLHVTYALPQTKIDGYRANAPGVLRVDPYLGNYHFRFNVTNPVLKDARVRRALAMAVDREGIVRDVTRGGERAAHCFTPPDTAGYTCRAGVPTDFEGARRLLAEAGFPGGRGLGPVEILINTDQNHRRLAEVIQQTWSKELGVAATIKNEEFKVYLDSLHTLNYCAARSGWIGDYNDPFTFLGQMVTGGGNNDAGYANPAYDALIGRSLAARDAGERRELFQQAEAILLEDAPVAPVYFYTRVYLQQPSVRGWYPNILDRHMPKFIYLEETPAGELGKVGAKG